MTGSVCLFLSMESASSWQSVTNCVTSTGSEAMLTVCQYLVALQMIHGVAYEDLFLEFATQTCYGDVI